MLEVLLRQKYSRNNPSQRYEIKFVWGLAHLRLVLPAEYTSCNWVIDDNIKAVTLAGRNKLMRERARDRIVHSLVDCGSDPVVVLAGHDDLCNFESGIVREAELNELAGLV